MVALVDLLKDHLLSEINLVSIDRKTLISSNNRFC